MTDSPDAPSSTVDLWSDDVLTDPHPTYAALRELGPAVRLDRHDLVALPRYDEVREALADWQTFSSAAGVGVDPAFNAASPPSILRSDPPEHTAIRRPLQPQLTRRRLDDDAAEIEAAAAASVDALVRSGGGDVVGPVRSYAVAVLSDLVGIEEADREGLGRWPQRAFNIYGPVGERFRDGFAAMTALRDQAASLVAPGRLRAGSRGAELVERGEGGRIIYYTTPGIDTAVHGITAALHLLAADPALWTRVRADPSLVPAVFDEALRLHSPVQYFTRTTTTTADVGGTVLPPGTRVLLMLGSANRDERHFTRPDEVDLARDPVDHLAYGRGVHRCVGAPLAEREAHAFLRALVERVERIEVVGAPRPELNNVLTGLGRLDVRLIAAP